MKLFKVMGMPAGTGVWGTTACTRRLVILHRTVREVKAAVKYAALLTKQIQLDLILMWSCVMTKDRGAGRVRMCIPVPSVRRALLF